MDENTKVMYKIPIGDLGQPRAFKTGVSRIIYYESMETGIKASSFRLYVAYIYIYIIIYI